MGNPQSASGLTHQYWGFDVSYLLLLGAIFFTIFPVTFNTSLRLTEASRGELMLATMPLWSVLLGRAAKRERLSTHQMCGVLLTFAGVGVVLAERGLTFVGKSLSLAGDGLMLVTSLCGAVYGVLAKRMLTRYNALTVTAYTMMFGTLAAGFRRYPFFPLVIFNHIPYDELNHSNSCAILTFNP